MHNSTSIYISNLSEDVWPFISCLKPLARKQEINENALLSDRDLLSCWVNKTQVIILPASVDHAFIKYLTKTLGSHQITILIPNRHTGQVCLDILSDKKIMSFLSEKSHLFLTSYTASAQFYQLVTYLKNKLKIQVDTPEAPDFLAAGTVNTFGSKSGLRQLLTTKANVSRLGRMATGVICKDIEQASQLGANFYHKYRGVVLKTSKGHAGLGVLIFRSGDLPSNLESCRQKLFVQLKSEKYWSEFPIVVEKLLEIDLNTGGGNPSIEVYINQSGRVYLLYQCGMRVTEQGVFKGIAIHRRILPPSLTNKINRIGQDLGTRYAKSGYRGYFDVDLAIDVTRKIFITESNVRRTGGTHVFLVARHLLGPNFDNKTFVLSNNLFTYPKGNNLTFNQLHQKLDPILFDSKTKTGIVLAGVNLLAQRRMAYIIFGQNKHQALELEAQMERLLSLPV